MFVNAIRYLAKTGIAWADLPAGFGKSNNRWQRYNRWCRNGVWERIAGVLRDRDTEWRSVDSSCVRASVAAAGAKKVDGTGPSVRGVGPQPGGFGTKIHAAVTPLGHPVALERTRSEASDSPWLPGPIAGTEAQAVLADKGYDSDLKRYDKKAANFLGFVWLAPIAIMLAQITNLQSI